MRTVGLLQDIPIHVGEGPVNPRAVVPTTFYVLDVDNVYSLILGREFLSAVHGLVDVPHHRLQFTTRAGSATQRCIPLSAAKQQPIYREVARRLAAQRVPKPDEKEPPTAATTNLPP